MDGFEEGCEGYGNRHSHSKDSLSPDARNQNFKFSSIEERVDSGLGSLSYNSLDSGSLSLLEEEGTGDRKATTNIPPQNQINTVKSTSSNSRSACSTDLANSLSRLTLSIGSGGKKLVERCDSGLDEERDNDVLSTRSYLNPYGNVHWVSPQFTPDQIVEIFRGDEDGDNHLHLSIIHNLPEVTMQIIGMAPAPDWLNQTNNLLQTPLHIAVLTRQVSIVRRLVCAGALVDMRDQMGNTPLHSACGLGFEDIVRELLSPVRAEETYQNKYDSQYQRIPQDLEMKNYEGLAPFHLGAIGGHVDIMRLLLAAGANINAAEGKSGRTVLHFAADWGNIRMADFLLSQRGTDIDARTYSGLTPLLLAWGRQHVELTDFLYSKGALVDVLSEESDADDDEMSNGPFSLLPQRQVQAVH